MSKIKKKITTASFFLQLATMFPNRHVTMVLRASRAPYITTTPRGINLTLPGEVSVNVTSAAGQTDPILKIRLVSLLSGLFSCLREWSLITGGGGGLQNGRGGGM